MFRFDDVEVGAVYITGVGSRRYAFQAQVVRVTETLVGIELTAQKPTIIF